MYTYNRLLLIIAFVLVLNVVYGADPIKLEFCYKLCDVKFSQCNIIINWLECKRTCNQSYGMMI